MKTSAAAMLISAAALVPAAGASAGETELASALRQQIVPCWTMLTGQFTQRDTVTLTIKLHLGGSVDGTPETVANNAGPALAASVRRAVLKCQPYHLPPDQYDRWKEVKITFRPGS